MNVKIYFYEIFMSFNYDFDVLSPCIRFFCTPTIIKNVGVLTAVSNGDRTLGVYSPATAGYSRAVARR